MKGRSFCNRLRLAVRPGESNWTRGLRSISEEGHEVHSKVALLQLADDFDREAAEIEAD
jgi:hypothetical protein